MSDEKREVNDNYQVILFREFDPKILYQNESEQTFHEIQMRAEIYLIYIKVASLRDFFFHDLDILANTY